MIKSPFFIVQDFLSAKACETLISQYEVTTPVVDINGNPTKLERFLTPDKGRHFVLSRLKEYMTDIEQHYGAEYFGVESLTMIHFPEDERSQVAQKPGCENSQFVRKKWIKNKDVDLTGYIWLKDFNDNVPLDPRYEVYGGKLEFPAYDFSLVPERGTLVLFPAYPHFITAISPVLVSDLYQIKVNITLRQDGLMWLYDPKNFPCGKEGFIKGWFSTYL